MKKFNLICVICMIIMILGIVHNFIALENGIFPVYNKVMLMLNGILLGMAIGECYMGNMIVRNKCNFDRKEDKK